LEIQKIVVIIGTRPNFIELAPIIHELNKIRKKTILIYNTGQHYDKEMSEVFFNQLEIPKPHRNFEIGSGLHGEQTSKIITKCEQSLLEDSPDVIIVEGDTTSSFAAALTAVKLKIPIIHLEAGCRAYDKNIPEEINRIVISHISSLHFPPTETCKNNLIKEGIDPKEIKFIGHPLVDSVNLVREKMKPISEILNLDLSESNYFFVTVHRDFNTDNPNRLESILKTLDEISKDRTIIFPIHPRTRKNITKFHLEKYLERIISLPPVDYLTSLTLIKNAYAVISDSGGLSKECSIFAIPHISLRENTEWIETLNGFANQLAFSKDNTILNCLNNLNSNYLEIKKTCISMKSLLGNSGTSKKIVDEILNFDFK